MLGQNDTPFAAIGFEQMHRDGQRMAVLATRAAYHLHPDGALSLAGQQAVVLSDSYDGPPVFGPLLRTSDLVPFKPRADVTVLASAHAPKGEAIPAWTVGVKVDQHVSVLRVFGPRQWEPAAKGFVLGTPERKAIAPIDYRVAAGGRAIGDPKGNADLRNPIGAGLIDAKYTSPLHSYPAPSLDSEAHPVADSAARPEPQGFGPVAGEWQWRSQYVGDTGEAWQRERAPSLPKDFDYRHYQCAHPGLILPGYVRPGAEVVLGRLSPGGGQIAFNVPDIEPYALFKWIDGREVYARMNRDGLHIDMRGPPPWPVDITFRAWIEICPRFYKVDAGLTDAAGAASLPVSAETGLMDARG